VDKIGNKKSFGGTGEMIWGTGRSPQVFFLLCWASHLGRVMLFF